MDAESYYWYKSHHICTNCCKNRALEGRTKCKTCLEKNAASGRKRYANLPKEIKRKYYDSKIKKQKENKANGLCYCGKPLDGIHKTCEACRKRHRIYYKNKKESLK